MSTGERREAIFGLPLKERRELAPSRGRKQGNSASSHVVWSRVWPGRTIHRRIREAHRTNSSLANAFARLETARTPRNIRRRLVKRFPNYVAYEIKATN